MHQASAPEAPTAIAGDNRFVEVELHTPQPGPGRPRAWMRAIEEISEYRPPSSDE